MEWTMRSVAVPHKERTWIYCRTDSTDASVLRMQEEALNIYAQRERLDVAGTTSEQSNGLSLLRDGIAEISHAVEQKKMDVLLVSNMSRLGRNSLEVLRYIRWLNNHGVRVICLMR